MGCEGEVVGGRAAADGAGGQGAPSRSSVLEAATEAAIADGLSDSGTGATPGADDTSSADRRAAVLAGGAGGRAGHWNDPTWWDGQQQQQQQQQQQW